MELWLMSQHSRIKEWDILERREWKPYIQKLWLKVFFISLWVLISMSIIFMENRNVWVSHLVLQDLKEFYIWSIVIFLVLFLYHPFKNHGTIFLWMMIFWDLHGPFFSREKLKCLINFKNLKQLLRTKLERKSRCWGVIMEENIVQISLRNFVRNVVFQGKILLHIHLSRM